MPIAVETLGAWGPDGLRFVREVGVRLAIATGEKRSGTFLLQRMSLAVQRGNVAAILGTLPPGLELDEVYLF
jgi:hypothetical protein